MPGRLDAPGPPAVASSETALPLGLGPDGIAVLGDGGLAIIEPGPAGPSAAKPQASREHGQPGLGFAFAKRGVDLVLVIATAVVWVPLYLVLAALVLVVDGRPIHYTEPRVGRGGREFQIVKLRSMRADGQGANHEATLGARVAKSLDDPRLTGIGRRLRRASLDELPQLFNVLVGHMSLVGPRPVTRAEVERFYGEDADLILSVRPGLTGLWQVSGRSTLSYADRVALEARYVRERGPRLDAAILLRTIPAVISGHGAY